MEKDISTQEFLKQLGMSRNEASEKQHLEEMERAKLRNTEDAIYFNFSYTALKLLGKNLYNNPWTAISELVANGVDAKADEIYIYIDIIDKGHATVEIIDNGLGMDYDDLAEKYVWIGRNKREDNIFSGDDKNAVMGRKGIGKLAALYLTNKYYIISKKAGESTENQWVLNMQAHRDSDYPKLDRLKSPVKLVSDPFWCKFKQGTAIRLVDIDLRRFGNRRIEGLKRTLADFYLLDSMQVKMFICTKERPNQKIEFELITKNIAFKNFFAIYDNTGKGYKDKISDSMCFPWLSNYPHIGQEERPTVIITDEDITVKNFSVSGEGEFQNEFGEPIKKKYNLVGWMGIHCTIEQKNANDKTFVRNDAYQPNKLRLYVRKKLAVASYFDMRKSTQTMADYVEGEISFDILDDNDLPDIATSSRQDFLEDERVAKLISIVDPIVNTLFKERNRVGNEIRLADRNYKEQQEKEEQERLRQEAEARKKAEEEAVQSESARKQAEDDLRTAEEKLNIRAKQTYFLEGALTMDSRTAMYNTHVIKCNAEDIERNLKSFLKSNNVFKNNTEIQAIAFAINKIIMTAKNFSIINYDFKRNVEQDDLGCFVEQYFKSVASHETDIKIEVQNRSKSLLVFPYQDVTMALYNIISNAIKANANNLTVKIFNEQHELLMQFIDDGDGIKSNIELNSLFDFGVSYTRGTGIGLAQIKDLIVNEMKGKVCIKRNENKGITLEVRIPNEN